MSNINTKEFKEYYKKVLEYVPLTDEEIIRLFVEYEDGNIEVIDKIVNNYLKVVVDIVFKFGNKVNEDNVMDLIHQGNLILYKAIADYHDDKQNFSNYIVGEIRREISISLKNALNFSNSVPKGTLETQNIDREVLIVLKELLDVRTYYCFYTALTGASFRDIGDYLGISEKRAFQIYINAYNIFLKYGDKNSQKFKDTYNMILKREGKKIDKINVEPILLSNVIKFLYLKQFLTSEEANLFYYRMFSKYKYTNDEICTILKFTRFKFIELNKSLKTKIESYLNNDEFEKFKNEMFFKYGSFVCGMLDESVLKKVNYSEIKRICDTLNFNDIQNLIGDNISLLNADEISLLKKFFGTIEEVRIESDKIEMDINLRRFGFNRTNHQIPASKLYNDFIKYKDEYTEEQQLFLECYYFRIKDRDIFKNKYPDSPLYYRHYHLINRLEKLHYGIHRILENNFSKQKYLTVRDKFAKNNDQEKVDMLDLYYGINGKRYTITEIAKLYGYEYLKTHDIVSSGRDSCISLYANRSNNLEIDKELYIPYLAYQYEYTEETRKILRMYLVEEITYDEIAKRTGLTKYRISNIITDGVRKIDFYRFGLSKVCIISVEELEEFFKVYKKSFNVFEREVIRDKFIRGIENSKIAEARKIDLKDVNILTTRFYRNYDIYKSNNTSCEIEDIIKEVNRHKSESFLNDQEKMVVSLFHGIKNDYNFSGEKLTYKEISEKLGISLNVVHHNFYLAIDKIKERKAGIKYPDLFYFERDELDKILDDNRLPISDKEKEIICYLFALKGYSYKTLKDLSEMYGEGKNSIRRRYYRSIVTIKKYLNGEIEEKLSYEEDIIPLLKYFSIGDRMVIEDHFKNKLTYEKMAKKYKLSFDKIVKIMVRIKINIFDLLHEKDVKKFDFDYYLKAIEDERFPFYGDLDTAKKMFDLFFGMKGPQRFGAPEIIKKLNLDCKNSVINNCINELMLDTCKLRDGMYKEKEFSYDEILDYYNRRHEEMAPTHKVYYDRYFDRVKNNKELTGRCSKISDYIIDDLLEEKDSNYFRLSKASRMDALRILKAGATLPISQSTRKGLMYYFQISGRDLMNGKEINHIYRIMDNLVKQGILVLNNGVAYKKD